MKHEDLILDDKNFIQLRCSPRVVDFFNRNAIFFGAPQLSPNLSQSIRVTKHGNIEKYVLFGGDFAHSIGAFSYNHSKAINIKCGRYCSIGNNLTVLGERHPIEWVTTSNITYCFRPDWNKPNFLRAHAELMANAWSPIAPDSPAPFEDSPLLGHDVWVADSVFLARNIKIGTGAVIGAAAVVTKDVDPYMIVAGNPARPIRQRFSDSICEGLISSSWWNLHPDNLFRFDLKNPKTFLDQILDARSTLECCSIKSFDWQSILDEIFSDLENGANAAL